MVSSHTTNDPYYLQTNVNDADVTIFYNTVLRHVESIQKAHHAAWEEASHEVNAFLGETVQAAKAVGTVEATQAGEAIETLEEEEAVEPSQANAKKGTFDPDMDAKMPLPGDAPTFPAGPTRPRPNVSIAPCPDTGIKCAEETWVKPLWLDTVYQPQYAFELLEGIIIPTIETTTYALVVVNDEDDISPEQVMAIK
jgi:hypothetical protein